MTFKLCNIIGHVPSKRHVRPSGRSPVSDCRFCGERLRQFGPNQWVLDIAMVTDDGADAFTARHQQEAGPQGMHRTRKGFFVREMTQQSGGSPSSESELD